MTMTAVTWMTLFAVITPSGASDAAPTAAAVGAGELLALTPGDATMVIVTDHERLSSLKHYPQLTAFLVSQRLLPELMGDPTGGLPGGAVVTRVVGFALSEQSRGFLLRVRPGSGAQDAARAHAQAKLGAGFREGRAGGRPTFGVDAAGRVLVAIDDQTLAIAEPAVIEKVLALVGKRGAGAFPGRAGYAALAAEASRGDAPLWSVGFVPELVRQRLARRGETAMAGVEAVTLRLTGTREMTLDTVSHTLDEAAARAMAQQLNERIDQRIASSLVLRGLGVGVLADKAKVRPEGDRVVGSTRLTEAQFGLGLRLGPRLIRAMRQN